MRRRLLTILALVLTGCPEPLPAVDPIFPEDYATEWTMVRDCRTSIEHDLVSIRVWANPIAREAYETRTGTLPEGAILLKEEFANRDCTDSVGWGVMRREEGFAPRAGDWHWQQVDADRRVVEDGAIVECFLCHEDCGQPPDGFDWTCAIPP